MSEKAGVTAKTHDATREVSISRAQQADISQPVNSPADYILFLQRTVGNQAVGRLIRSGALQAKPRIGQPGDIYEQEADRAAEQVMRMPEVSKTDAGQTGHPQRYDLAPKEPKAQRDRIADAISNHDPNAIREIADFHEATDDQRLRMIRIIHSNFWVGPLDEAALERIWSSFGYRMPLAASTNWNLWLESIDRGAELDDLNLVEKVKETFLDDVKKTAFDFLLKNRLLAEKEKARFGIGVSGADVTPAQQTAAMIEVQNIAQHLWPFQEAQDALRRIHVGYEVNQYSEVGSLMPAFYDPSGPPTFGLDSQDIPPGKPWPVVNQAYQALTVYVARFSNRYPSIYALIQSRKLEDVANASQPQARSILGDQLSTLVSNIDKAGPMIGSGELDARELWPIHRQLFEGKHAPSGLQWNQTFYMWASEDLVKDHQTAQFWTNLGLTTLAAAAFIVSEIATFGTATFFIAAGVGLGIGIGQAAALWEKADDLSIAAHSTVSDELSLVYNEQASAAEAAAILATAQVILNAAGLAARGVSSAIARSPPSPAGPPPGIRGVVQPDGTVRPIATGTGMPKLSAPSISTGTVGAPAAAGGGAKIYPFPAPQGTTTGPVTTGGTGSFVYSGGAAAPKFNPSAAPAPTVQPIPTPVTIPVPAVTPALTPGVGPISGAPFFGAGAAAGTGAATQASQQPKPAPQPETQPKEKKKRKECRYQPNPSCPIWTKLSSSNQYWDYAYAYRIGRNILEKRGFGQNIAVLLYEIEGIQKEPIIEENEGGGGIHSEERIFWILENMGFNRNCKFKILGLFSERKPCIERCQPGLYKLCLFNNGEPFPVYFVIDYYNKGGFMKTMFHSHNLMRRYAEAGYDIRQ